MKMHVAKDIEGVPLNLAVAHMGIAVFQGITRINTFSWAKIRKISFKRKRFLVKLHPEGYVRVPDIIIFSILYREKNRKHLENILISWIFVQNRAIIRIRLNSSLRDETNAKTSGKNVLKIMDSSVAPLFKIFHAEKHVFCLEAAHLGKFTLKIIVGKKWIGLLNSSCFFYAKVYVSYHNSPSTNFIIND